MGNGKSRLLRVTISLTLLPLLLISGSATFGYSQGGASTATTLALASNPANAGTCPQFAKVTNVTVTLCGRPFRFVGVNSYEILAGYLGIRYIPGTTGVIDPTQRIADAAANNLTVLRFGFEMGGQGGGYDDAGDVFGDFWQIYNLQPDHRTFFQAVDRLVADAKQHHVYLIPTLALAYFRWQALGNNTDFFQVNGASNLLWKSVVKTIVSHYSNETQILMWEIAGEPDNIICGYGGMFQRTPWQNASEPRSMSEVITWAQDAYHYIKSVDPNHIVEVGWNLSVPDCWNNDQQVRLELDNPRYWGTLNAVGDVASIHIYYEQNLIPFTRISGISDLQKATLSVVKNYTDYAHDVLKKPILFGEFGSEIWNNHFTGDGYSSMPFIQYFLQGILRYYGDGALIWGWEADGPSYYISPVETPAIAYWLRSYSSLVAANSPASQGLACAPGPQSAVLLSNHSSPVNLSGGYVKATLIPSNNTIVAGNYLLPSNRSIGYSNEFSPIAIGYDSANRLLYVPLLSGKTEVVDKDTGANVTSIGFGGFLSGVAYNPSNGYVYLTARDFQNVTIIDGATNKVVGKVPVGTFPYGITYDSTNNDLYVANAGSGSVTVINGTTDKAVASIPVGTEPYDVTFDKTNGYLYVANAGSDDVSVIDGAKNAVVAQVAVGHYPYGLAYDSSNGNVYVIDAGSNDIRIINSSTNVVTGIIALGFSPNAILYDSTDNYLYVIMADSDNIVVVDGASNAVVSTIDVGASPSGLTYDPTSGYVYVTNFNSGTISVIAPGPSTSAPKSREFTLQVGIQHYLVGIRTNSSVTAFNYDQCGNSLTFALNGPPDSVGYANVTIPRFLLNGTIGIGVNGTSSKYQLTQDNANYFVYVTYSGGSATLQVTGIAVSSASTTTTTPATTSTTTSSSALASSISSSASVTSSSTTSFSQTGGQTTSSASTGSGGIPEFPYQLVAATAFAFLLVASYLLVRRHRAHRSHILSSRIRSEN